MTESVDYIARRTSPISRLACALWKDRNDFGAVLIYTLFIGLLSLVVPLGAQVLVNFIAAGILLQPVIILSALVLIGLLLAGALRICRLYLVELIQQRVFAQIALHLAGHVYGIKQEILSEQYGPELVNRFFDTLSIQRTLSKLLVNVPAALAQVLIGLILMASYSPLLLAFDLVIMGTIVLIALLGRGGLRLSIEESGFKYNVAHWLEEIARCHVSFKLARADRFVLEQTDQRIVSYIEARKAHFQVLLRQNMGNIVLQAFGGAGILAIGGWLVINRQLTLGQLVAAELVMIYVLSAMDVLTTQLEDGYDLLTGYEKVGEVVDLPTERTTGLEIPSQPTLSISCRRLHFAYDNQPPILKDLNLDIEKGQKVSLVGSNGAGKTTFAYLLAGLLEPSYGTVLLGGTDIRELELRSLRRKVTFIGDASEIFSGTIEENITLGQPISRHVLQEVVDQVLLTPMLVTLPKGLQTQLNSEGRNLSLGQRQQILVARALVGQPELIIVDEALTGMDQLTKTAICEILLGSEQPWTLLVISHDPMLFLRTEKIYVLKDGHIVESGAPKELLSKEDSELLQLFPAISRKFLQEVLTA